MAEPTAPRNADETLAVRDQLLSDADQRLADADQWRSDCDQAASDRALSLGASAHAHALSRDDRLRATLERQRATRARLATGGARNQASDRQTPTGQDPAAS